MKHAVATLWPVLTKDEGIAPDILKSLEPLILRTTREDVDRLVQHRDCRKNFLVKAGVLQGAICPTSQARAARHRIRGTAAVAAHHTVVSACPGVNGAPATAGPERLVHRTAADPPPVASLDPVPYLEVRDSSTDLAATRTGTTNPVRSPPESRPCGGMSTAHYATRRATGTGDFALNADLAGRGNDGDDDDDPEPTWRATATTLSQRYLLP